MPPPGTLDNPDGQRGERNMRNMPPSGYRHRADMNHMGRVTLLSFIISFHST